MIRSKSIVHVHFTHSRAILVYYVLLQLWQGPLFRWFHRIPVAHTTGSWLSRLLLHRLCCLTLQTGMVVCCAESSPVSASVEFCEPLCGPHHPQAQANAARVHHTYDCFLHGPGKSGHLRTSSQVFLVSRTGKVQQRRCYLRVLLHGKASKDVPQHNNKTRDIQQGSNSYHTWRWVFVSWTRFKHTSAFGLIDM